MKEERISLRPIVAADGDFMVKLVNDPEIVRYIPGLITNGDMMQSWTKSLGASDHEFIVELDGISIGECSLTCFEGDAEIGFMILPEYWGHGYGTQVVQQLLRKAKELGISEITATTDVRNTATVKLLKRADFAMEKTGWMLRIPEEGSEESDLSGQHIIEFHKGI